MSRLRGALPGLLLATVCGVYVGKLTPTPLLTGAPTDKLSPGLSTFGPAFQDQADKKTFEYLQREAKAKTELGDGMLEVVPVGKDATAPSQAVGMTRKEVDPMAVSAGEKAMELMRAEKEANRPKDG